LPGDETANQFYNNGLPQRSKIIAGLLLSHLTKKVHSFYICFVNRGAFASSV